MFHIQYMGNSENEISHFTAGMYSRFTKRVFILLSVICSVDPEMRSAFY